MGSRPPLRSLPALRARNPQRVSETVSPGLPAPGDCFGDSLGIPGPSGPETPDSLPFLYQHLGKAVHRLPAGKLVGLNLVVFDRLGILGEFIW